MKKIAMFAGAMILGVGAVRSEHGLIKDLDKNGDKKLSWEEVEPIGWNKETFELKDMNGDGKITEQELWMHVEWLKTPAVNPKIVKAMDKNGDGQIQMDEWWWDEPDFKKYDTNKNKILEKEEVAKIPKATVQKKFKMKQKK